MYRMKFFSEYESTIEAAVNKWLKHVESDINIHRVKMCAIGQEGLKPLIYMAIFYSVYNRESDIPIKIFEDD